MNNKDLFNAIHDIDENYIANAWDNTEADRPIVLRPEQRPVKRTARNIMLGVGSTAAAAALGFVVITGANGTLSNPFSGADDPDESTISYIKDEFNHRKDGSDFDPNSPIPVNIIAPDGNPLTYNDLVGASIGNSYNFWEKGETAEEIAQMDYLFENFFDIISVYEEYGPVGFWNLGYVYLPEPGSDKLKRYNRGDIYCGLTIADCSVSFDTKGKYYSGSVSFDRSLEIPDVVITRTGEDFDHLSKSYDFISNDPKLTVFNNGLDNEKITGIIHPYTEIPLNIPFKTTIEDFSLSYLAGETPSISLNARIKTFEPFNDDLKQWLEKDLVLPNASLSEDFNFLSFGNIFKEIGDEIRAVDDGEVIETSKNVILIKHGENLYTSYMLLDVLVNEGDTVKAGDVIGVANCEGEIGYKFTQEKPDIEWFDSFGMDQNSDSDSHPAPTQE